MKILGMKKYAAGKGLRVGLRSDSKSDLKSEWVVNQVGAQKSEFRFQNLNLNLKSVQ
jgi:hypothetical protein